MQDDKNENFSSETQTSSTENKADIEIKDKEKISDSNEQPNGIFHVTRRYKWIFSLSAIILFITSILIFAKVNGALGAEYWQIAIWGVCGLVSIYSIIKKSLASLLFNLVLFLGVSLIPAWILVYKFFKPILELITGTKLPEVHTPYYW